MMTKKECSELVDKILGEIIDSNEQVDLINILDDTSLALAKYKMKLDKYPKINFQITSDDLKEINYRIPNEIDWSKETTLTKLLYSIVWKNGDLGKENHIIKGILGTEATESIVFYQLGKHLSNNTEHPIFDQHVLRAFQFFNCNGNPKDDIIEDTVTKKKHEKLANEYVMWLNQLESKKQIEDFKYWVDQILFALGKKIKKELAKD